MDKDEILKEFRNQFSHLEKFGLKINGISNLMWEYDVISITTPFIFNNTLIPKRFMGLEIRNGTPQNDLPESFQNINTNEEYIWAYQRFEAFVDANADIIRNRLENPMMTRDEMLDAICFGDFKTHKRMCEKWEEEGKIPKWQN